MAHLIALYITIQIFYCVTAIEKSIIWSDDMDTNNQDGNWNTFGAVDTASHSPFDSRDICWNIMRTNAVPNPYIYRVTDLSSEIISNHQRLTIDYNIIPWDLQTNMRCQVFYGVVPFAGNPNIDWMLVTQYNDTHNGDDLSSQSHAIPIHNTEVEIAIKFMLYNLPTSVSNLIGYQPNSACYLSTIRLTIETETFEANSVARQEMEHETNLISGNVKLDLVLLISFAVLFVVLCAIVTVLFLTWCMNSKKNITRSKNARKRDNTATSLQLGQMEPDSAEMSPKSWTGATAHLGAKKANSAEPTAATPDRQPSFDFTEQTSTVAMLPGRFSYSTGLSQVITKTANFFRYDTETLSPTQKMNEGRITPRKNTVLAFGGSDKATYDVSSDKNTDIVIARWHEWEEEQKQTLYETDSLGETLNLNNRSTGLTQFSATKRTTTHTSNAAVFAISQSTEITPITNTSMLVSPPTNTYSSISTICSERASNVNITPKEPIR